MIASGPNSRMECQRIPWALPLSRFQLGTCYQWGSMRPAKACVRLRDTRLYERHSYLYRSCPDPASPDRAPTTGNALAARGSGSALSGLDGRSSLSGDRLPQPKWSSVPHARCREYVLGQGIVAVEKMRDWLSRAAANRTVLLEQRGLLLSWPSNRQTTESWQEDLWRKL